MTAKALNETIGQLGTDKLLADPRDIYVTTDEQIAAATEIKRGQLLKFVVASSTVEPMVTASSSGGETTYFLSGDVFGIAAADASGADGDVSVPVYVQGAFNLDAVEAANNDVALGAYYTACRNIGLIMRRPEAAQE